MIIILCSVHQFLVVALFRKVVSPPALLHPKLHRRRLAIALCTVDATEMHRKPLIVTTPRRLISVLSAV